jgi:opacity protein-like surface antigen
MLRAALAALLVSVLPLTNALAADVQQPLMMPPAPVQVMPVMMPAVVEAPSSWYLRGDIGVSNMQVSSVDYLPNPLNNANNFTIQSVALQDQAFFLVGVGYEFNSWLRFDATAEYRNKDSFVFWGGYTTACPNPFAQCLDVYNGYISSWVFLANAYVDLFTWCGLTPFVGVGIGTSANTLGGFSDVGIPTGGAGTGPTVTDWELAWAIHAGLSYRINENLKLEFAYRYLNMGSVQGPINCIGGCNPDSYRFHNLEAQDFMIGFRWMFSSGPAFATQYVAPAPQYVAPAPQYVAPAPQMVPAQPMMVPAQPMMVPAPPLSTRG